MALDAPIEFLSVSDDGKTIAATGIRYDENSMPEPIAIRRCGATGSVIYCLTSESGRCRPLGRTVAVWFDDDTLEIVSEGSETCTDSHRPRRVG